MSGEWVGYFSHRAPASEGGGAAMQFASMQIELSDDGDAILGSGADGLGSFELQRGRRAVEEAAGAAAVHAAGAAGRDRAPLLSGEGRAVPQRPRRVRLLLFPVRAPRGDQPRRCTV